MEFNKLAALGAQGVAGGSLLAWLGLMFVTRPVPTGGIDSILHLCLGGASFAVFALVALAHVWFAQQLKVGREPVRG